VIVGGTWLTEKIRVALLFVKPREDAADPTLNCRQLLLLSSVKPAEILGFWPDVGTVNARG
jgi:hypothetical protein